MKDEDVFNSINSTKELRNFLEMKGKNHKYYYHYTTWDTFIKIYENKYFLATNHLSKNLNDQHELRNKKGDNLYHVSFSYGEAEIMPMWILYGIPKTQAVRIGIPKKNMKEWIAELQMDKKRFDMVTLTDIIYQNEKNEKNNENKEKIIYSWQKLHRDFSKNENLKNELKISPDLVGCVKHYAWRYENEVRLLVSLPQKTDERIKLEFSDDIRDSFETMTGPHFDLSTYKNHKIYKELVDKLKKENNKKDNTNGNTEDNKEDELPKSTFKTEDVNYRELCGNCIHEFCNKTEE